MRRNQRNYRTPGALAKAEAVAFPVQSFHAVTRLVEVLAPERNREHSIGDQVASLNVGLMERLRLNSPLQATRQKSYPDRNRLHYPVQRDT